MILSLTAVQSIRVLATFFDISIPKPLYVAAIVSSRVDNDVSFCKLSSSLFCPVCLAGAYNGGQCALNGFFNDAYLPKSRGLSARRQTSNLDGQGLLSGIFFPYTTSVSALTLSIHPELKSLFSFPRFIVPPARLMRPPPVRPRRGFLLEAFLFADLIWRPFPYSQPGDAPDWGWFPLNTGLCVCSFP